MTSLFKNLFSNNSLKYAIEFLNERGIKVVEDKTPIVYRNRERWFKKDENGNPIPDEKFSDKLLLVYDMIKSKQSCPFAIKSRGIIIDVTGEVVSRKFDRFFNYGEMTALTKHLDYSVAEYYPKLDGSLIGIWYDKDLGKWRISTKGTINGLNYANLTTEKEEDMVTYVDLVYRTIYCDEGSFQSCLNDVAEDIELLNGFELKDHTLIFELCTKENLVITPYEKDSLTLIGCATNTYEDKTLDHRDLAVLHSCLSKYLVNIKLIEKLDIKSEKEALDYCKGLKGLEEGLVIFDPVNNIRVKMKNPRYVWVSNLKKDEEPTIYDLASIAFHGETSEFCTYFPQWKESLDYIQKTMSDGFAHAIKVASEIGLDGDTSRENMALFASSLNEKVSNPELRKLFFSAKRNKTSLEEELKKVNEKFYVSIFKFFHKE